MRCTLCVFSVVDIITLKIYILLSLVNSALLKPWWQDERRWEDCWNFSWWCCLVVWLNCLESTLCERTNKSWVAHDLRPWAMSQCLMKNIMTPPFKCCWSQTPSSVFCTLSAGGEDAPLPNLSILIFSTEFPFLYSSLNFWMLLISFLWECFFANLEGLHPFYFTV